MSGIPSCARSKCKPLGVIVPSSACSGVRADPVPVVLGSEVNTRAILLSKCEGCPYATNGALTSNYPILAVALWLRPDVAVGTKTLFTFDPGSNWNVSAAGPVYAKPITPAAGLRWIPLSSADGGIRAQLSQ